MAKYFFRHNQSAANKCLSFEELRQKYIIGIEEKICSTASREEAKRLLDHVDANIEQQCESNIIRMFFKRYFNELLERYWP